MALLVKPMRRASHAGPYGEQNGKGGENSEVVQLVVHADSEDGSARALSHSDPSDPWHQVGTKSGGLRLRMHRIVGDCSFSIYMHLMFSPQM